MTHATSTFTVNRWEQKTWDGRPANEVTGSKLTHEVASYTYSGDIEGESTIHYLMFYRDDGTGNCIALERIEGTLAGRSGSFVVQQSGAFAAHGVDGTFFVIPGSGTGALTGLRGEGKLLVHGEPWQITLDYTFVDQ